MTIHRTDKINSRINHRTSKTTGRINSEIRRHNHRINGTNYRTNMTNDGTKRTNCKTNRTKRLTGRTNEDHSPNGMTDPTTAVPSVGPIIGLTEDIERVVGPIVQLM